MEVMKKTQKISEGSFKTEEESKKGLETLKTKIIRMSLVT